MKTKKFTAGIFVCVIVFFMCSVFSTFISDKLKQNEEVMLKELLINWEKLYPFSENSLTLKEKQSSIVKVNSNLKKEIEDYTSKKNLHFLHNLIEIAKNMKMSSAGMLSR